MRFRYVLLVAVFGLILAACSSTVEVNDGVASLSQDTVANEIAPTEEPDLEEALLTFAQCMRDEGLDFPDPIVGADGSIEFQGPGPGGGRAADRDQFQAGFTECGDLLDSVTLPFQQNDFTEIQDMLVEFASCMRDNGYDMPDPDFSNFGPGQGGPGQGNGPFGGIDPDDPAFQEALQGCEDILAGFGPGNRTGPRGPAGGAGGDG